MLILRSKDHPEADGRRPSHGDVEWTVTLPLEGGEFVQLKLGKKSRDTIFGMLIADCQDSGEAEPA